MPRKRYKNNTRVKIYATEDTCSCFFDHIIERWEEAGGSREKKKAKRDHCNDNSNPFCYTYGYDWDCGTGQSGGTWNGEKGHKKSSTDF